jgi:hypothetical protein
MQAAALASPRHLPIHLRRQLLPRAPSDAKLWRGDTPRCATRSPRLRLCFRTAGFGMHQDRLSTAVVAFSLVPGLLRGPGVNFAAADLQRGPRRKLCDNPNWPMIPSVAPPQTPRADLHPGREGRRLSLRPPCGGEMQLSTLSNPHWEARMAQATSISSVSRAHFQLETNQA